MSTKAQPQTWFLREEVIVHLPQIVMLRVKMLQMLLQMMSRRVDEALFLILLLGNDAALAAAAVAAFAASCIVADAASCLCRFVQRMLLQRPRMLPQ